jgi:hypothetical protein
MYIERIKTRWREYYIKVRGMDTTTNITSSVCFSRVGVHGLEKFSQHGRAALLPGAYVPLSPKHGMEILRRPKFPTMKSIHLALSRR